MTTCKVDENGFTGRGLVQQGCKEQVQVLEPFYKWVSETLSRLSRSSFALAAMTVNQISHTRGKADLAVHAVGHAAMAGDAVAKVLDFEAALEAAGKEAAKGRDHAGKQ